MMLKAEKTHWIERVSRKISEDVPEVKDHAQTLAEKLGILLLTRLPSASGAELLELLPESYSHLKNRLHERGDRTIGYSDFVEKTFYFIPWNVDEEIAFRVANCFLEHALSEIPAEVRSRVCSHLPTEITVRMKPTPSGGADSHRSRNTAA